MPQYFYTAKSLRGDTKTGVLEAKDEHELGRMLHVEGYVLVSANLEGEKKEKLSFNLDFFGGLRGVSLTEKMMFTRNLQVMAGAGISLPRAIRTLAGQSKSKKFKDALIDVADEVMTGKRFSESLAKYPNIFSVLYLSMVKVGEEAGTMEDILKNLTHQMEREHELRSKVKGAMMYPLVILCAMVGVGYLMLVMVVPKLSQTFRDLGAELPISTQIVMNFADFMAVKWYLAIMIVIGVIVFFRTVLSTKIGKKAMDTFTLRMPLISPIVKKMNAAYTTRILASLFSSGVPIVRALEVTSETLGNYHFRQAMTNVAEEVRKGAHLGEAMKPYEYLYSSMVIQMVEVGEETGETSSILAKLADFYEEEVTQTTKNLSAVIEPIMMVIIGVIVGFFAVAMMQPLYGMLGSL